MSKMDGRYTIGTANRYAMFLGEEDESGGPQDIKTLVQADKAKKTLKQAVHSKETPISNKEVKEVAVKKEKPLIETAVTVKNDEEIMDMETVKNRRNREEKTEKTNRNSEVGRATGPPRQPRREGDRRDGDGPRRENDRDRPRREARERGTEIEAEGRTERRNSAASSRPRPRPSSRENPRKREFERKSGSDKTGVKSVDKREGGGAHNWGTHKDDLNSPKHANLSDVENEGNEIKPDYESDADDKRYAVVEEVKELTLEEYRALRGKRNQPKYNLRRAGEGEDQSQWKGLVELEKKKKEITSSEDDEDLENFEFPQRASRQKQVLDIDITFKEQRRTRPTAGPRPGPRETREPRDYPEGKPNYGPRRPYPGQRELKIDNENLAGRSRDTAAPRVDDEKAFPSLG